MHFRAPSGFPFGKHPTSRGAGPGDHAVQFYESEEFLASVVASFLDAGLVTGESAVVVATEPHLKAFRARLQQKGFDLEKKCRTGQLTLIDAWPMLSKITLGGMPHRDRFRAEVGKLLSDCAQGGRGRVCVYGEMVDMLCKEGRPQAALRLEELWNELGRAQPFSLLCAYDMSNFHKVGHADAFQAICKTHNHVIPTERYPQESDATARLHEVTLLQQSALALESEITRRKQLEIGLRLSLEEQRQAQAELQASQHVLQRQQQELARTLRVNRLFMGLLDRERPLTRGTADLGEICRRAIEALGVTEVAFETTGNLVGCWDGDRLVQLVGILISNALAHAPEDLPVRLRADGAGADTVTLEVHNAGAIPAELLPMLFAPPLRGAGPTDAGDLHEGLRLDLRHGCAIAQAHGASLELTSSERDGTRFIARFPRLPGEDRSGQSPGRATLRG